MVTVNRAAVPRCAAGHVCVAVTRGSRLQQVCPECLRLAVEFCAAREPTVNDYLAKWDADGAAPQVTSRCAAAAAELHRAAAELHDGPAPGSCRRVVRDAARAAGVTSAEAMRWTLNELVAKGLTALRAKLQAA